MSDEGVDYQFFREHDRLTAGASAWHALDPAEAMMRREEELAERAERERDKLREEIFCGFLAYLFAEGPAPAAVCSRIEGYLVSFSPKLVAAVRGERVWWLGGAVEIVLGKHRRRLTAMTDAGDGRGALSSWYKELSHEVDRPCVTETLVALGELLISEGNSWRLATATAYCLAKLLRSDLIGEMSLEDLAVLSGDAGRATVGDRCKRIYNQRLAAAGMRACLVHFQKSEDAVATYAEAQRGNSNRRKKPGTAKGGSG